MALTLANEQRLKKVGLERFFNQNRRMWLDAAKSAHKYITNGFPNGSAVRPDDIKDPLKTILEVNDDLQNFLSTNKLKQKYWFSYFADLVVDRTWDEVVQQNGGADGGASP